MCLKGTDPINLPVNPVVSFFSQEALFVTEKTLSSALDQLDATTMPLNNNDKMPDLEVTDMSDDQLTIQLSVRKYLSFCW